jgi:hypothetical protein
MKNITFIFLLASASSLSWAEISSLSSEELTDTYIKDTTVIVRQPKEENATTKIPVKLKVTPLEETAQVLPDDQNNQMASISNELSTYDDLNNFRALDNETQIPLPPATTEFLQAPTSQTLLDQVRLAYDIESELPVDLTNLNFEPVNPPLAADPVLASSVLSTDDRSLTLRIPNNGNFNSQQIQTPNGEISVNVTPDFINYTINLPK